MRILTTSPTEAPSWYHARPHPIIFNYISKLTFKTFESYSSYLGNCEKGSQIWTDWFQCWKRYRYDAWQSIYVAKRLHDSVLIHHSRASQSLCIKIRYIFPMLKRESLNSWYSKVMWILHANAPYIVKYKTVYLIFFFYTFWVIVGLKVLFRFTPFVYQLFWIDEMCSHI